MTANDAPKLYGLLAEYDNPEALVAAIKRAREAGYTKLDGYSPYGVAEIADALGFKYAEMSTVMLCGGLVGATAGFCMQWWANAIDYPVNVGGRALLEPFEWLRGWASFIPVTFEGGILTCALSGLFGLLAICGLPRLHHPLFNNPTFATRASRDRFFLTVDATDPKFDLPATRDFLLGLAPLSVAEVPE
jgi:Alternative complex III, ActD subunit